MTATVTALRATRPIGQQIDVPPRTGWVRLLQIEDNATDAALIQAYIRNVLPDVAFDTATRISDVTEERANAADCAILDLSLPDASGLEALVTLRSLSARLPIIVLTGFDDLPLGLAALGSGAEDYLVKNHVDGTTLERAIRYAIERRRLSLGVADTAVAAVLQLTPPVPQVVIGPHEVTVGIEPTTGEYALRCQVCSWQAVRGPADLHSWSDRELGWALLSHVDFGGLGQEDPAPADAPASDPAGSIPSTAETLSGTYEIGKFVARRTLFSVKGCIQE